MNQIQEKNWAEESWYSHTGIDSSCDYCIIDDNGRQSGGVGRQKSTEKAAGTKKVYDRS
jgi:hypothetical protein